MGSLNLNLASKTLEQLLEQRKISIVDFGQCLWNEGALAREFTCKSNRGMQQWAGNGWVSVPLCLFHLELFGDSFMYTFEAITDASLQGAYPSSYSSGPDAETLARSFVDSFSATSGQ